MQENKAWSRLDNAAKIFPPTSSRRDTKVFRFLCELTESVEPVPLQHALERTITQFPFFRSTLKKGMFWYYLEDTGALPQVAEEHEAPCAPLYDGEKPGPLFRVLYYGRRINLELHHALADGSGALQFLRTLVFSYLSERHGIKGTLSDDASPGERELDAFYKYYDRTQAVPKAVRYRACHIRGEHLPDYHTGVTEGILPASAMLAQAHTFDATLSEFLVAQLICAVRDGMAVREHLRPVVVSVPVDLRRFFPAQTARNFFGLIHVAYHVRKEKDSFEQVLAAVRADFARQLTRENLEGVIGRYAAIENHPLIKSVPLQLKIPSLKLAGWWAGGGDTVALSNLGRVTMPTEAAPYIRLFDVVLSTGRPQICLCSFGDTLAVSVSSPLADTGLQRRFFQSLTALGLPMQVVSDIDDVREGGRDYAAL